MYKSILCMTTLAAVVAPAFAAEWMTDFEAAKAKAAQENKAILVDFTGSDWCGYCIKLRKDVLDTPAFAEYAADKFVLMEVDLPKQKKQDPALKEQNQKLCRQYGVSGFPTLLVLTPEGKVMGGMSGYRPTLQGVSSQLNKALATWSIVKRAEAAEGEEKAKLLFEAYKSMPEDMRSVSGMLQDIAAADTNNVTGVRDLAMDEIQNKEIEQRLQACGSDPEKIKAVIEEYIPKATPNNKKKLEDTLQMVETMVVMKDVENAFKNDGAAAALTLIDEILPQTQGELKIQLLSTKFQILVVASETVDDLEEAKAAAAEMRDALPPHMVDQFDAYVERTFANPEELLKKAQKQREAVGFKK